MARPVPSAPRSLTAAKRRVQRGWVENSPPTRALRQKSSDPYDRHVAIADASPRTDHADRLALTALGLAFGAVVLAGASATLSRAVIATSGAHLAPPIVTIAFGTGIAPMLALASIITVMRMRRLLSRASVAIALVTCGIALPLAA